MQYFRLLPLGYGVVGLGLAVLGALIAALVMTRRGATFRASIRRSAVVALLGLAGFCTLAVTLVPAGARAPEHYVSFNAVSDLTMQFGDALHSPTSALQILINLLLFSWIGLLVPLVSTRASVLSCTLAAAAGSIVVEVAQYGLSTGRASTLSDVLLNVAGGFLGAAVGVALLRPRFAINTKPTADAGG